VIRIQKIALKEPGKKALRRKAPHTTVLRKLARCKTEQHRMAPHRMVPCKMAPHRTGQRMKVPQ
jgi:hypothetical protein